MVGGADLEAEEFREVIADLLGELLPELMLCLPDWSEVEARSDASP